MHECLWGSDRQTLILKFQYLRFSNHHRTGIHRYSTLHPGYIEYEYYKTICLSLHLRQENQKLEQQVIWRRWGFVALYRRNSREGRVRTVMNCCHSTSSKNRINCQKQGRLSYTELLTALPEAANKTDGIIGSTHLHTEALSSTHLHTKHIEVD